MQRVLSTSPSSSDSTSENWVAIEKEKKNTATIKYSIILFVRFFHILKEISKAMAIRHRIAETAPVQP